MPTVIMMVGIPASGKTTWATNHAKKNVFIIHSSDDIRRRIYGDESIVGEGRVVFGTLKREIDSDISKGKSIIIDTTALEPRSRKDIKRYHDLGYHTVAVVMDTDFEECKRRNSERARSVPEEVMERMHDTMQYPTYSEGFDEIIVIK